MRYMQVDRLLELQHPLSAKSSEPVHDEHLFIIMHQSKELWFLQLIKDLEAARAQICLDCYDEASMYLVRCRRIIDVLQASWEVLATLRPREFWRFRKYFGNASGLQSAQFRHVEFLLGLRHHVPHVRRIQEEQDKILEELAAKDAASSDAGSEKPVGSQEAAADAGEDAGESKGREARISAHFRLLEEELERPSLWDEVLRALGRRYRFKIPIELRERDWRKPYPYPRSRERGQQSPESIEQEAKAPRGDPDVEEAWLSIFAHREDYPAGYRLGEALLDLASSLALWRQKHILTVQRFIGDLPGSGGTPGVPYLNSTLKWRIFPELWSIQNRFSEFEARERAQAARNTEDKNRL
jgi:tryptophan 2,3-dioxygenase